MTRRYVVATAMRITQILVTKDGKRGAAGWMARIN